MEAKPRCSTRLAVYDSFGNLLGYKADTFWQLSKKEKYAKFHSAENARPSSHLFRNLLYFLNEEKYCNRIAKKGHFDENHSLYVIAEDIKSDEIISHVSVRNTARKKYKLAA